MRSTAYTKAARLLAEHYLSSGTGGNEELADAVKTILSKRIRASDVAPTDEQIANNVRMRLWHKAKANLGIRERAPSSEQLADISREVERIFREDPALVASKVAEYKQERGL